MESELILYEQKPLTAKEIRAQVNLIQEVMKSVMQEGQHYGRIPGCGDKPTLLKPGAEKLISTFNLCPDFIAEDLGKERMIRYRVICKLLTMSNKFVGSGLGECSSEEEKYRWRASVSNEEWEATPENDRRIKYYKGGGTAKQVKTNPYDLANTILKMAKKRALVDATLTRTAASDIFTQDIEDMPEEYLQQEKKKLQPDKPSTPKPEDMEAFKAESEKKASEYHDRLMKVKNFFELKNYWTKHGKEIKAALMPEHFQMIEELKDSLKTKFEGKEESHD